MKCQSKLFTLKYSDTSVKVDVQTLVVILVTSLASIPDDLVSLLNARKNNLPLLFFVV